MNDFVSDLVNILCAQLEAKIPGHGFFPTLTSIMDQCNKHIHVCHMSQ